MVTKIVDQTDFDQVPKDLMKMSGDVNDNVITSLNAVIEEVNDNEEETFNSLDTNDGVTNLDDLTDDESDFELECLECNNCDVCIMSTNNEVIENQTASEIPNRH